MSKVTGGILGLAMALFLSIGLISCGSGGGGGGAPAPVADDVISLSTSTIRTYAANDFWKYTISGTVTVPGYTPENINGTLDRQILSGLVQSPIALDDCMDRLTTVNISLEGGGSIVQTSNSYILQDAMGSISFYGENNISTGQIWIINPVAGHVLAVESPVAVGQSNSYSATYNDGSTETSTYTVDGIENVSTGIGTFEAYKITTSYTFNYSSGEQVVASSTHWFVPALGSQVKIIENASYYSGGVLQFSLNDTADISLTNVPH